MPCSACRFWGAGSRTGWLSDVKSAMFSSLRKPLSARKSMPARCACQKSSLTKTASAAPPLYMRDSSGMPLRTS